MAHPPLPKDLVPFKHTQCDACRDASPERLTVQLMVVFRRKEDSSFGDYDPDLQIKAYDVAFSPELYPVAYDDDNERRTKQTRRLMELAKEYADYSPENRVGKERTPQAMDVEAALAPKKNRRIPKNVAQTRFWDKFLG